MPDLAANKRGNDYYLQAGRDVYEACPKAVWAAIAISALTDGGSHLDDARARVLDEWYILCATGIVPQRPPKTMLRKAGLREGSGSGSGSS